MGLVSGDTLEVNPRICVCLRRGEVRTAELAFFMRLSVVLVEAGTIMDDALVEMRCFEGDECYGYDDDNWY